ncbi:malonate decarboxylase subunit epsilon [Erwinia sp. S43]|uniref:malonate decarboxylase subunit epsilon n=1 Tax=Erwinia sp. S43 TaxID=2769339 RepID=UPI00190CE63F|nr:malonate decarboxylase subunit epsilon [Erwinia sp. S43]MBK0032432.1 malonate decarboxylase subunit epsilon [Erwinia sp. S43]
MKVLFSFPGQGAQRPGMLQQLPDGDALLDEVSDVLAEDARRLDSAEALRHTRAVQLCILISGVAHARALERQGTVADMTAGLSIGAYPAAVVAGSLAFSDALRLVSLRGTLMENAWPQGYGLTAIVGFSQADLLPLLGDDCWLANVNSPQQLVIAGSDAAMARVGAAAKSLGAQRACRLAVSVPSHCELLAKPAQELAQAFQAVTLHRPRCAYLSGSSARVLWQPQQIADDLAWNMARRVNWYDAMAAAEERDVGLAIQMPPGSGLTGLTRQSFSLGGEAISLEQSGAELASRLAQRARG